MSSTRLPLYQQQIEGSQATYTFDQLTTNSGFWCPCRVIFYNNSQNSGKCYTFITAKRYKSKSKEETHRERYGRVPNKASMSSRCITFPVHRYISLARETHPSFRCPVFLLGFHYVRLLTESLATCLNSIFSLPPLPGVWESGLLSRGSQTPTL